MNENSYHTKKEIFQQPDLWLKVYEILLAQRQELMNFIDVVLSEVNSETIFTGAGSSFFVAEMVAGNFQKHTGVSAKAVSTTEIVTHPDLYINAGRPTLLVSFARSGDSPESIAAVELANQISHNVAHLIITCNKSGKLAKTPISSKKYVLLLPEETNDRGLAMTSSVTAMALAALLLGRLDSIDTLRGQVVLLSRYAKNLLDKYTDEFIKVAELDFQRVVFLGSGPFLGSARESHLKVQELTDGKSQSVFDSFLAFRHGHKVVVDENTLMVYFLSNNEYSLKYEKDLIKSLNTEKNPLYTIGLSENKIEACTFDLSVILSTGTEKLEEDFLVLCTVLPSQLLGFFKSINLGLNPDSPSEDGTIHRVVHGVTIYPFIESSIL